MVQAPHESRAFIRGRHGFAAPVAPPADGLPPSRTSNIGRPVSAASSVARSRTSPTVDRARRSRGSASAIASPSCSARRTSGSGQLQLGEGVVQRCERENRVHHAALSGRNSTPPAMTSTS
jgi:hypothetical protein